MGFRNLLKRLTYQNVFRIENFIRKTPIDNHLIEYSIVSLEKIPMKKLLPILMIIGLLLSCSSDDDNKKKTSPINVNRSSVAGVISVADLATEDNNRCTTSGSSRHLQTVTYSEETLFDSFLNNVRSTLRKLKKGLKTFPEQPVEITYEDGQTAETTINGEDGTFELTCNETSGQKFPATLSVSGTNYKTIITEEPDTAVCDSAVSDEEASLSQVLKNINEVTTVIANEVGEERDTDEVEKISTRVVSEIFGKADSEGSKANIPSASFVSNQPGNTEEDESLRAILQEASADSNVDLCNPVSTYVPLLAQADYVDSLAGAIRSANDAGPAISEIKDGGSTEVAEKIEDIRDATPETLEAAKRALKTVVLQNAPRPDPLLKPEFLRDSKNDKNLAAGTATFDIYVGYTYDLREAVTLVAEATLLEEDGVTETTTVVKLTVTRSTAQAPASSAELAEETVQIHIDKDQDGNSLLQNRKYRVSITVDDLVQNSETIQIVLSFS